MAFERFCCYDLRGGLMRYGIFTMVVSILAVGFDLIFSMTEENPDVATRDTFLTGGHVLNIGIKGSLAYGAYKENRMFLLPYLILECIGLALLTIIAAMYMFQEPILILLLLLCGLFWYIWLCVLTFYQMLDPHNPNYIPRSIDEPATVVYLEQPPPAYHENKLMDHV